MKRLFIIIMCFITAIVPIFSVVADTSLTVTLTGKGQQLYINAYNSLADRIKPNGYAATSTSGAYEGMYIKDAGVEALALTANGSFTDAQEIFDYVYQYHTLTNAPHFYTRVGEITSEYTQNNFTDTITTGEAFENISQSKYDKVVADLDNGTFFACKFFSTSTAIKAMRIYLNGSYTTFTVTLAKMDEETGEFVPRIFHTEKEPFDSTDWKYIVFDHEFSLELSQDYYLIFSAEVPEGKKLQLMGTTDIADNLYYNASLYGNTWTPTKDALALVTYTQEITEDAYSSNILDFSHNIGGHNKVVQQIPSNGEQICEIIINVEKNSSETTDPLKVSLYSDAECTKLIDSTLVDADEITSYAKYIIVPFSYLHTEIPEYYYLCLTCDSTSYNSYYWYGTTSLKGYTSLAYSDTEMTDMEGEFSYFTAKMKMPELSTGSAAQSDTAFIFLHSFAQWYLTNPDTVEKTAFANKVWSRFSSYAKYFLNSSYFSSELNLVYNPQLQHISRTYSCYDLSTNVFASQALYELSQVASELGKTEDAETFKKYSELVNTGIKTNLITERNGKKIYAEMILKQDGNPMSTGFSYINLSPAAANWYSVDNQILLNTYDAYLNEASISIGEYMLTDAEYILSTGTSSGYALGQNVAWELLCALRFGNSSRAKALLSFLDDHNENLYAEKWSTDGLGKDRGNQEQCGWLVYTLVNMFPSLAINPVLNESQNGIGVDIYGSEETVTPVVDETWPLSKILVFSVMVIAGILIIASLVLWIVSRRSGMRAYAKAMAAKRHRERIVNESFEIKDDDTKTEDINHDGFSIKTDFED